MCLVFTCLLSYPGYVLMSWRSLEYTNYQWTLEDFPNHSWERGDDRDSPLMTTYDPFMDPRLILTKSSDEDRIRMLYKHARILLATGTDPKALMPFVHGLKVLSTREFATAKRDRFCQRCFSFNFKSILPARNVCGNAKSIDLLIMITSVPENIEQRKAVRETWGSYSKNNSGQQVRHVFLFGGGWNRTEQGILQTESQQYKDILQEDFVDSYYNLSYKVVMGLQWALNDCILAENILRTADDNFINPPALLSLITDSKANLTKAVLGYCMPPKKPERGITDKHMVSYLEWPQDVLYPPYCEGTALLMSATIARLLLKTCVNVPYFPLEDVYLGMVMERAGIITQSARGFSASRETKSWTKCQSYYSIHEVSVSLMREIWATCHQS